MRIPAASGKSSPLVVVWLTLALVAITHAAFTPAPRVGEHLEFPLHDSAFAQAAEEAKRLPSAAPSPATPGYCPDLRIATPLTIIGDFRSAAIGASPATRLIGGANTGRAPPARGTH